MPKLKSTTTTSILIADQHPISSSGIKYFLNSHFDHCKVVVANSPTALSKIIRNNKVTHLITDVKLAESGNAQLFNNLRKVSPALQIMVYNTQAGQVKTKKKIQSQVDFFLPSVSTELEIIGALNLFLKKGNSSGTLRKPENVVKVEPKNPFEKLSEREKTVLHYLLKGHRVGNIATKMKIAPNTAATFKLRIFKKLKISNSIDLYKVSQAHGFLHTLSA